MKKFNILVIDDHAGNKASLQEILVANDFMVKTAVNSKAGLQLLAKESFDLVFIESLMPGMNSYQTCKAIKADSRLHNIPVIFVVRNEDLIFVKEIYESGGDDYIVTPLVWSELLMKTNIHLELKYSREMSRNMNQLLEAKVAQRTFELEDSLKKLGQAKKDLELLSVAKSEFLNLISHEIRTPLNGILGSLALIGRYQYTDEVNRYFSLLDTSVKRLEKFTNIILEASTLRIKGEKALVFSHVDLIRVMHQSINECAAKFLEKSIEIILQNETNDTSFKGDSKYLEKCFTAILDNAFKFSAKGNKVEITITNEANGFFRIAIADYGRGFSKLAMENIYKPLSNLESHFDQNTGMGLHLAKLIVDAHSGSIRVGNRETAGAIVEISLPAKH